MNSMPDMIPAILQTPMSDSSVQDKSSPDKSEFASLVEKECSKSTHCKSDQKEIKSDSVMKEADGLSSVTSASNDCSTYINNTIHNTSGNKVQQNTDDIKPVNEDEENTDDEADPVKGIKTGALLFSLVQSYIAEIKNASEVSTGDGTTESTDIEAGGLGSESELEKGLKVTALLNNLMTNHVSEIEGKVNLDPGSVQSTGLNGIELSDLSAGNGLKVGSLLNNLVTNYTAETGGGLNIGTDSESARLTGDGATDLRAGTGLKVGTVLNNLVSSNAAEIEVGGESGEVVSDSQVEKGLKIGELLNRLTDRSDQKEINNDLIKEEMASAEKKIDINTKADDSEADSLIFKKEIPSQAETRTQATGHVDKYHADDKTSAVDMPDNNDSSEGLKSRPVSGTLDQFKQESGAGDHEFNFTKGQHNSGNEAETNNVNSINSSNTAIENAKSVQSPSALHTAKTPGVQELLDNVIYVIKGNSKMGVSVEHENFGKLNISLNLEKGMVNVHINASDHAVREIIENNIQHIIDSLNKDGVSVGEFSVGLRDQKEDETNRLSQKNGQGREIPLETKKENRHSGLVNIFA